MSGLKLTPGDKKFLSILKVGLAEDILPNWQDYAHALERESLLIRYIQSDKLELAILTQRLADQKAAIIKLDAENFGLWAWLVVLSVMVGGFLTDLLWRLI